MKTRTTNRWLHKPPILHWVLSLAMVFLASPIAAQVTDFESFSIGSVNYQGGGSTTVTTGGYTVPDPYGSLWTVADEWGFTPTIALDEGVVDDGSGNNVWRISNAVTQTGFSNLPFSLSSALAAGESTAALWNDRGDNHTAPLNPPLARSTAGTSDFHANLRFKSATGAPQAGLSVSLSPGPRQLNIRQAFVSISDNGATGLNIGFFDTDASGGFISTTLATDLSYTDWHELDIYVTFVDGLNGDGSGNDVVSILLDGVQVHVGTTWETFYALNPFSPQNPYAVDALMFRVSGTAQPALSGGGLYFDDVLVDNASYSPVYPVNNVTQATGHFTIQAAIDAATAGDSIFISNGTYALSSTLEVDRSVVLQGESQAGVILDASAMLPLVERVIETDADNITMRNMTIKPITDPDPVANNNIGFTVKVGSNSAPAINSNIVMENIAIDGAAERTPFDFHGLDNVTLTNLSASGTTRGNGMSFSGCTNVTVNSFSGTGNLWGSIAIYASRFVPLGGRGSDNITIQGSGLSIDGNVFSQDDLNPIDGDLFNTNVSVTGWDFLLYNDDFRSGGDGNEYVHFLPDLVTATSVALIFQTLNGGNTGSALFDLANTEWKVPSGLLIQTAIDQAAANDIIRTDGTFYIENLVINKAIDLRGANYGVACGSRSTESVIAPSSGLPVNVTADGVSINGFEITAPSYQYAVLCGNRSDLDIAFNYIHDINSSATPALTATHAIQYTVGNAPAATSNVNVLDNCFENIGSANLTGNSATAMGFLQSTTTGTLTGLTIARNSINNVQVNSSPWPTGKIAYGIQLNAGGGGSYLSTTGKIVNAVIEDNVISNLGGHIATGIGLEGNTENASVTGNDVSALTATKSAVRSGGGLDLQALKFENNRYAATCTVQDNRFAAETFVHDGTPNLGYAVANYVPTGGVYSSGVTGAADVSCNWLGSAVPAEIADNAALTGKLLSKAGAAISAIPFNTDGTDNDGGTFGFQPAPGACIGVGPVYNVTQATAHFTIQEGVDNATAGDSITVAAGTYVEDVTIGTQLILQGAGAGSSIVSGAIGGGFATFDVNAAGTTIAGFDITREGNNPTEWNDALNSAGISIQTVGNVEVRDCSFYGNRTAIDINNSNGNNIHDNIITNNRTGMILRNQTDNTVVVDNVISDNWTVGILFLDASGGSNSPLQQALSSTFSNNDLSGNWYGQVVDRQTGGSLPAPGANLKDFSSNWYGADPPVISTAASAEPGYAAQIPVVFGGSAVPPGGQPDILGEASANIVYCPYLDDVPGVGAAVSGLSITCPASVSMPTGVDTCGATVAVGAAQVTGCDATTLINDYTGTSNASGFYPLGVTTVNWTVSDSYGSAMCSMSVTVTDNEAPVVGCQDINLYLDATGNASLNAQDLNLGSTDNCAIDTFYASPDLFSCLDLGPNAVILTAEDFAGNSNTCMATVTVLDTIAPAMVCQDLTIYLDAAGQASITPADVDDGSADACSPTALSLDISSFDCSNAGPNTVTLTGTDDYGNSASCQATITVMDSIAPVAICSSPTLYFDASGMLLLDPMDVDGGSSDNCGIVSRSVSPNMFDCADAGVQAVTLTVTDAAGNSSSCNTTITLIDNLSPIAVCQNITVALNAAGMASITPASLDGGSTDNCAITEYSISKNSFDCSNLGANNVIFSVRDDALNANACVAIVTVIDTIPPVMACQDISIYLDAAGNASILPSAVDNGSADACSSISLSLDKSSFTCMDLGANLVTLTGTDASGNSATCTATVTVLDDTAPIALCQDLTVYLDASGNASIIAADADAGSSDACGIASMSLDQDSFDCSHVGPNTVNLTVTDGSGNSSSCSLTVTVEDTIAPVAICQDITIQLDALGVASIVAADIDGGSSDACGIASLSASMSSFDCSHIGPNPVDLTVTDVNGNSSVCAAIVTVEDNIAPVALCQDITVQLDSSGMAGIVPLDIDNGSNDACGIASLSLDLSSFSCADIGPNTVELTVSDFNSNSSTCSAVVTVEDLISPVALCQTITVYLDGAGQVSINDIDLDGGSNDACGIASYSAAQTNFDCSELGQNFVLLTVTDVNGNSQSCTATVNVLDTIAPVISCPADVTIYSTAVDCGDVFSFVDPPVSDNCSATVMQTAGLASGSVFPVGINTISYEATDVSGNTSSCSYQVTVLDTIAPIISCPPDITINNDPGSCDALVFFPNPPFSDNCAGSMLSQTAGLQSGSSFPVGVTIVEFTVTDASGNTATCSFTVTVVDNELPQIIFCPTNLTIPANPALCGAVVNFVPPSATDNCPGVTSLQTQGLPPASVFPIGITPVEYTFTDASGNMVSCSFTVNVTYTVPTLSTVVTNTTIAGGSDGAIDLTVSGGVPPFTFVWSNAEITEDISGLTAGTYTVTVSDANGCSFSTSATVAGPPCLPPTNLVSTPINPIKVNLSWDAVIGALNYNVRGRRVGTPNWRNLYTSATSKTVSNLIPGQSYEWQIRVQCADMNISVFSPTDTFTLPNSRVADLPDQMDVYPNPADAFIHADYSTMDDQRVIVSLIDQLGRVIFQEQVDLVSGVNALEYDASRLAEGLYFLTVSGQNGTLEERISVFHK